MQSLLGRARAAARWAGGTVPGKVVRKFGEDQGANQAVLIAWNTLTSIFPIALALAGILGLVLHLVGLRAGEIYGSILGVIPGDKGNTSAALDAMQQRTGVFFLIGLGGLLWSGSSLFGSMEQAFDLIFHVEQRSFVRQKLMAFGMILLFTGLAGFAVFTSSLLPLLKMIPLVPPAITHGAAVYVLTPLAGVLAGVLLFGAIYYVVPNRKQRLGEVWPGALLAGCGFYALTLLFPLYITLNKGIAQYGKAFAFLFVVTTFFYFIGLLTMVGLELNAVLYPVPVPQPDKAERLAPSQSEQGGERLVRPGRGRRAREPDPEPRRGRARAQDASGQDASGRPGPTGAGALGGSRLKQGFYAALGALVGVAAVARQRRRRQLDG